MIVESMARWVGDAQLVYGSDRPVIEPVRTGREVELMTNATTLLTRGPEPGMSLSPEELERFAAGLAAAPERWQHLVRHDDQRVYEQIWDDEEVNAWLICWSEDSDTGFHDHDDSAAGITVVSGSVREDRLTLAGPPRSRELGAGATFTVRARRDPPRAARGQRPGGHRPRLLAAAAADGRLPRRPRRRAAARVPVLRGRAARRARPRLRDAIN